MQIISKPWLCMLALALPIAQGAIQLSEFMAINDTSLLDADGDSSDWIELYNAGTHAVDLVGWHLTDDATDPVKWTFPAVTIPTNGYLVVFASDKFPTNIDQGLHTNFRLDGDGEYLALIQPDGSTIEDAYAPAYPRQVEDTSFGIPSDMVIHTYLATPSPGTANSPSTTIQTREPSFSHTRGFYDIPFQLVLSPDDAAETIRYTLDGSRPSATHGTWYTGPFQVTPSASGGAITVRAVSSRTGYADSDVRTHTFIFMDTVLQQPVQPPGFPSAWDADRSEIEADYEMDPDVVNDPAYTNMWESALTSIPTLSIATEIGNLWDINGSRGIYDHARDDGISSERAISAEFIFPGDEGNDFQIDCGLRIQGGASRGRDVKHSLSLRFRSIYGDGKLDFPLFPGSPVTRYDSLALRAEYNNSWTHWSAGQRNAGTLIRDDWARKAMLDMGNPSAGEGRFVHVYLNGLYWGVYNLCERPNHSHYAAYRGLSDDSQIDARNGGNAINGNNTAWNEMTGLASNWTEIQQRLNMTQYIDFTLIQGFSGNRDLKTTGGNWRSAGGGPERLPFELYPWDTERTLEQVNQNAAGVTKAAQIFNTLFGLTEFKVQLGDRIHHHLFNQGALTVPACLSRWQNYTNRLYTAMIAESARWGDYKRDTTGETTLYTRDNHWIPESVRLVEHYFPARSAEVLADWRAAQWYPDVEAPAFNQHGGGVQHGFNLIIDPGNAGTLWYTVDGSDPRLEGGNVDPHARSGPLGTNLLYTTTVRARMRDGPDWSALNAATFFLPATNIVVSEIMYNPPNPLHAFIELKNGGSHPLVLDGVRFTQGIRFDFNASSIPNLAPGMYLLVVRDRAAFETRYGTQLPVAGCFTGKFDKGGEQLVLVDGQGNTIVDFTWNDSRSWPSTPDGAGHSLVPLETRDALLDFGGNWRASAFIGGSPGEADPEPITDLVLNEILAHTDFSDPGFPDYDSNDGIEIYHAGPGALSLTNWYLSDDRNNLMKWGIPGTNTITGPGWIHFNEVGDFHNPTNSGFGLDKAGEEVLLSYLPASGPARVADAIRFKGEEKNVALGRYPDGAQAWYHLVPTPGSANGLPPQAPLVISEIMYHPPPTPSHPADNTFHEFIELYNPGTQTVSLETDAGPWRIDGGVSFTFPAGTSVSAGEYLLLVQFSPMNTSERTSFLNHYTLDPATGVYGPYSGKLSNRGERIAIEKPQEADQPGDDPSWVIVDEVFYYDNAPYATTADGQGYSLHRLLPDQPGEQAENWISRPPFPATPAEQVTLSHTIGGNISWSAQTGVTYILEFKDQLDETTWQAMDTPLGSGPIQLIDPGASTQPFRVYRIRAIP